ncbi:MAG: hypothetical protein AVDCRST_MAG95-3883 [uncultured Adhaeribacter sp.]|uniref:Uncharacterized protein n=1 Tax=uncultured Adhaeribacter sp. TaxID=448109 RepID=A0A6J4JWF0_9BACT|nr:MAG: hypothetical protein AVDCRST_MAG95-3883 [uncultured Adhaeribacter sp.]
MIDKLAEKLVHWNVWHLFYKEKNQPGKPNIFQKWVHRQIAQRLHIKS